MADRVLVTGGAGFIGSHLVDALLARGDEVRVLDVRPLANAAPGERAGDVDVREGDVRDRAAVDAALAQVTVVYHLADVASGACSLIDARAHAEVSAVGTAVLFEALAARRAQLGAVVVASTSRVYGDGGYRCEAHGALATPLRTEARLASRKWEPVCPVCEREAQPTPTAEDHPVRPATPHAAAKLAAEQIARAMGAAHRLPTITVRYADVYGSRQPIGRAHAGVAAAITAQLLHDRRPELFEDGQQLRDFTHVSDAVRATIAAAAAADPRAHEVLNVGSGRGATLTQLARLVARGLGRSLEPELTGEYRAFDVRHGLVDVSRARTRLAWEPSVALEDGVAELVAWASAERPEDATLLANAELRARRLLH